jgi:hypothetical protein
LTVVRVRIVPLITIFWRAPFSSGDVSALGWKAARGR